MPSTAQQIAAMQAAITALAARVSAIEADLAPNPQSVHAPPITLPSTIKGYWYWGFGGHTIAALAAAVPTANYLDWFAAVGTGSGGTVTLNGVGVPSVADIAAWKAAGKAVVLSIGGSASNPGSSAALTLNNTSDLAQMLASIETLISQYGFQGISIDLEADAGQWSVSVMASLIAALKAKYGAGFIIDMAPAPYQIRSSAGIYAQLYTAAGANIDYVTPQWYSQAGQTDSWFINSYILPDLAAITALGIPSTKIIMGCADNAGNNGAPGGAATYFAAWNQWKVANPLKPLGGMKWFHSLSDERLSWAYGLGAP